MMAREAEENDMRFAIIACLALLTAACSSTFEKPRLDRATGRFQSNSPVDVAEVGAPFGPQYADMVYVMTDSKVEKFNGFFVAAVEQTGSFKSVLDKDALEALVIQKDLADKVPSVSDLVGLNRLSKETGPFLVIEPTVLYLGAFRFQATLKATDASTGRVVLKLQNTATNWAGLDNPLFYPLFNALLDWTKGRQIASAPAR
jgi:hypothetical protein